MILIPILLVLGQTHTLTMSVYGNGDGCIGKPFANGETYYKSSRAVACNLFPKNALLRLTMPDGRKILVRNKDRIAKRFSRTRIDVTIAVWHEATSRRYGLIRGVRVQQVRHK